MQRPFLQSVGKTTHTAIFCLGKRTDSFMSTFENSPGHSLILFGKYNAKKLFSNFFARFLQTTIEMISIILLLIFLLVELTN